MPPPQGELLRVFLGRGPARRGLRENQVTEVATLAVPSLGLVSHPGRVLLGWCEHRRGHPPGGGTRQDTGALSALDRRPLYSNQEVGWAETD